MPDVILKNKSASSVTYDGIQTIRLKQDGGEVDFAVASGSGSGFALPSQYQSYVDYELIIPLESGA